MKKKQFEKLADQLLDLVAGGVNLGDLIIIWPYRSVLRGLMFERSIDKDVFDVVPFYIPLFAPSSVVLYLDLGFRLTTPEGITGWRITDSDLLPRLRWAISTQAIPFLIEVETEAGVLQALRSQAPHQNAHIAETYAHALARAGEWEEARRVLASVQSVASAPDVTDYPWAVEMRGRCDALTRAMDQSNAHARALLVQWEAQAHANMERELSQRKGYPPQGAQM